MIKLAGSSSEQRALRRMIALVKSGHIKEVLALRAKRAARLKYKPRRDRMIELIREVLK